MAKNEYAVWLEGELRDWVRELFPIGCRVEMSKKWTKNRWNRKKAGTVVGYQRQQIGPVVVHDGQKSRHSYHWSFIVPCRAKKARAKES